MWTCRLLRIGDAEEVFVAADEELVIDGGRCGADDFIDRVGRHDVQFVRVVDDHGGPGPRVR